MAGIVIFSSLVAAPSLKDVSMKPLTMSSSSSGGLSDQEASIVFNVYIQCILLNTKTYNISGLSVKFEERDKTNQMKQNIAYSTLC